MQATKMTVNYCVSLYSDAIAALHVEVKKLLLLYLPSKWAYKDTSSSLCLAHKNEPISGDRRNATANQRPDLH